MSLRWILIRWQNANTTDVGKFCPAALANSSFLFQNIAKLSPLRLGLTCLSAPKSGYIFLKGSLPRHNPPFGAPYKGIFRLEIGRCALCIISIHVQRPGSDIVPSRMSRSQALVFPGGISDKCVQILVERLWQPRGRSSKLQREFFNQKIFNRKACMLIDFPCWAVAGFVAFFLFLVAEEVVHRFPTLARLWCKGKYWLAGSERCWGGGGGE